jgi:hypothetical protein
MTEKWELKLADEAGWITPAQVVSELARCGIRVTERVLESWRKQGSLPPLERVEPLPGSKDARYVWRDTDVLLRVFTLLAMKRVRGRMDSAVVMTWLAGFDYPIPLMRELWAHFEELGWRRALRQAGEGLPINPADAVEVLVGEAYATRQGRKRSRQFVDALIRLDVDPHFDPTTDLTLAQADQIRRDLGQLSHNGAELMDAVRPEHVRGVASLIQDYYSAPKLAALIRTLPDSDLTAVHRDCRFVFGLYRGWLTEAVTSGDPESVALDPVARTLWPRIVWQAGRFLMLMDLAVRRAGLGSVIDATVDFL